MKEYSVRGFGRSQGDDRGGGGVAGPGRAGLIRRPGAC